MGAMYLSGPMTGLKNFGHDIFDKNAAFLRDCGYEVISPAELDRELGIDLGQEMTEVDYQSIIRHDYAALLRCSSICFLPGWENSRGARLESDFANVLKLDRYRVDADKSYFEKELIIAFTGHARSGKDSISQEFVQNNGFERVGFADSLKEMLYRFNPRLPDPNWTQVGDNFGIGGIVRVKDYVDKYGWEDSKSFSFIREALQVLGSEAGRDVLGENVWIDTLFKKPTGARVVIPDCRYFNEAQTVRRRGGFVIRINRDGVGAVNSHASDQIDFDTDFEVNNNGTVKDAYLQVCEFLKIQGIEI